jgi:hypothetical protein
MQGKVIVMSIVTILRSTLCKEDLPMPKSSLMVSSELGDWTGGLHAEAKGVVLGANPPNG